MVFSVQQGEHGPLVVYKLEVPAQKVAAPAPEAAGGASLLDVLEGLAPAAAPRQLESAPEREPVGEGITLDRINADISWRRETADRLRRLPFSPRF